MQPLECGRQTSAVPNVRFGSQADICDAKAHVRFAPNRDRERGLPQTVMSALPPKADIRVGHSPFIQSLRRLRKNARPGARRYESGDQLLVVALKVVRHKHSMRVTNDVWS
jgi:hypothetical protein